MKRRFVLPLVVVVGWLALAFHPISHAAETTPAPGTITTVAGTGEVGFSGDGGTAIQARLNWPIGNCIDAAGNIYFADNSNHRIRKVNPSGVISTVAGTGVAGYSGDGGLATEARLDRPVWLVLDGAGNLYFSQPVYSRVRKVSPAGIITTIVGTAQAGFSGDGGPATAASLNSPEGLAIDAAGNLFIADGFNQRIRKVSPDGIITTVAGSGTAGPGRGGYAGDGGPATQARLSFPLGLAVDGEGDLFFAETGYDGDHPPTQARVRKVSADGIISTVAGTGEPGFSGDGGLATEAHLTMPSGVAVDTAGNLFIADRGNYRVRKVDPTGIIRTVAGMGRDRYAGDGVPATTTGLRGPSGVTVDAGGNLLISDTGYSHEADGLGYNERVLKVSGAAAPGLLAGKPFPVSP